jgi:hypothetical protein
MQKRDELLEIHWQRLVCGLHEQVQTLRELL